MIRNMRIGIGGWIGICLVVLAGIGGTPAAAQTPGAVSDPSSVSPATSPTSSFFLAQVLTNTPTLTTRQLADPCAGSAVTTVPINAGFTICGTHDGANTLDFTLTVTRGTTSVNTQTKLVAALVNGAVPFSVPAQTVAGSYSARICARGEGGTICSDPLAFTVVAPPLPLKPGIRIIGTATVAGRRVPMVFDVERVVER